MPAATAPALPPPAASAAAPASVLVADDEAVNRRLLTLGLEREGHSVTAARNGLEAWVLLRDGAFDVVLLDVLMPGLDGFELLERIQADARLRHLPVIMISALRERESAVRCIELGADDYLPKPFEAPLLRARINAGLARKRLHDLEREYIEQVSYVVEAAGAVERGEFDPRALDRVGRREDALGRLARVFRRMAAEVEAREARLRRQVRELRIEIDERRAARQVAAITDTDYFRDLERKAERLRTR